LLRTVSGGASTLPLNFSLLCPQCGDTFSAVTTLRDHLQEEHDVEPADLPDILVGQVAKAEEEAGEDALGQVVSNTGTIDGTRYE
jgi:hypothetical protein